MAKEAFRPFSMEEHARFLDALSHVRPEAASGREWADMAKHVGNGRSIMDVKLHAHMYFVRLEAECSAAVAEALASEDSMWSATEEAVFEQALAVYEEADAGRWEKIAALLPGKTPDNVRRRYEKLLLDVARIEGGKQVMVYYRPEDQEDGGPQPQPPNAEPLLCGMGSTHASHQSMQGPPLPLPSPRPPGQRGVEQQTSQVLPTTGPGSADAGRSEDSFPTAGGHVAGDKSMTDAVTNSLDKPRGGPNLDIGCGEAMDLSASEQLSQGMTMRQQQMQLMGGGLTGPACASQDMLLSSMSMDVEGTDLHASTSPSDMSTQEDKAFLHMLGAGREGR